jgi:hypothetical protein
VCQLRREGTPVINVSRCARTEDGDYILREFHEEGEYLDFRTGDHIWWVGCDIERQRIVASLNPGKYRKPGYVTLWLR